MNYTQIADLYRTDEWARCLSHKIGVEFELQEAYKYDTELGCLFNLPKGLRLKFKGRTLGGWIFEPTTARDRADIAPTLSFGRTRLQKLKLKEICLDSDMEKAP